MLDLVYEMMIVGRAPNCIEKYKYITLYIMLDTLKKFFIAESLWNTDASHWLLYNTCS